MVCWCEVSSVNGAVREQKNEFRLWVSWGEVKPITCRWVTNEKPESAEGVPSQDRCEGQQPRASSVDYQDSAGSSLKDGSFHAIDVSPGVQWTIHIEGSSEEHTNNIRSRWWSSVASSSPFGKWRQRLNQAVSPHPCKLRWRSLAWCRGKMLEKSERQRWGRRCPIFIWADICDREYQPPGFDRMPFTTTRLPKSAEKTSLDIGVSCSRT